MSTSPQFYLVNFATSNFGTDHVRW